MRAEELDLEELFPAQLPKAPPDEPEVVSVFDATDPAKRKEKSPNEKIDKLIEKLLKKAEGEPPDVAVKIVAQAIAWEKVKHHITTGDDPLDPDKM